MLEDPPQPGHTLVEQTNDALDQAEDELAKFPDQPTDTGVLSPGQVDDTREQMSQMVEMTGEGLSPVPDSFDFVIDPVVDAIRPSVDPVTDRLEAVVEPPGSFGREPTPNEPGSPSRSKDLAPAMTSTGRTEIASGTFPAALPLGNPPAPQGDAHLAPRDYLAPAPAPVPSRTASDSRLGVALAVSMSSPETSGSSTETLSAVIAALCVAVMLVSKPLRGPPVPVCSDGAPQNVDRPG